ncbi:zinc finger protein ZIC 5 [Rhypophila decipiens]|uniref:Zinc finger protein ZIC 5 n=1 Tax=Rhypophila decipiens TaxID=261697 RepID=A0AAN6Y8L6_9PEZI|nr:zinc finger protein ZIC 5 [Rhypophila decipiens]
MANNHFSFPGTAYYFTEAPVFPSSLFPSTEDNLDGSMSYIGPVLQSPSTAELYLGPWDPSQDPVLVQRYLQDNQKTAYFNADIPSKMNSNRADMNSAVGISPVPRPPSHVRFASPISSPGPSSSSDNMHSPPTDTDSHYEPFGSPMADPLSLQFQQANSYDPHWATHDVQFMGVNLSDISPNSQPVDCYENESSNLDLGFSQRGFSFESYTSTNSQSDMEVGNNTATLDLPVRRLASPDTIEPVVKEEIKAATQYPPPPPTGPSHDVEMAESEGEQAHQPGTTQKRKGSPEDDGEYKPSKKKPNLNNGRRRQTRGRGGNAPKYSQSTPPSHPPLPAATAKAALPPQPAAPPLSLVNNNKATHPCPDCAQPFKDQTLLENHIKKQHTRPFICVFHFAGCPSTFASKNEWKRHVASQHLLLNYWLCDEGQCDLASSGGSRSSSKTAIGGRSSRSSQNEGSTTAGGGGGVIFNRKDLYTQHVRRMHMPPQIKKSLKQQQQQQQQQTSSTSCSSKKGSDTPAASLAQAAGASSEWETRLKNLQSRAIRERCKLPLMMTCPAVECETVFHGPDSWDQRMEHVARHLERAAAGKEAPVWFGSSFCEKACEQDEDGGRDRTLVEWASREDVGIIRDNEKGGWELVSLLKRGSSQGGQGRQQQQQNGRNITGGGQKGRGGIVMVHQQQQQQPMSVVVVGGGRGGGSKRKQQQLPAVNKTLPAATTTSNVRFAPVVKKEDDDQEMEIKNEIVVTSSDDDDDDENEIVVDGEGVYEDEEDEEEDGLADAEGEEED